MESYNLVERIRQRAYEIWESRGCPDGQDLDHWLQAEIECRKVSQNGKRAARSPRAKKISLPPDSAITAETVTALPVG